MEIKSKLTELYKQGKRNQFAKAINKTQNIKNDELRSKAENEVMKKLYVNANKKRKNGDLDIFREFLLEAEIGKTFIDAVFLDLWNTKESDLAHFASEVGIDELTRRYGNSLGDKLNELYSSKKIQYLDIQQLLKITRDSDVFKENNPGISTEVLKYTDQKQGDNLIKLLDIFTNENVKVGIHRTGGSVSTKTICREGLHLTGHLSSGVTNNMYDSNIESTLSKNVSFYEYPGMAIYQTSVGGNYKNSFNKDLIDIILVGIPKNKFGIGNSDIILYDNNLKILNPDYILGGVTVSSKSNSIIAVSENKEQNKYSSQDIERLSKPSEHMIDKEKEKIKQIQQVFAKAYTESQKPEYQQAKSGFMSYVKDLLKRNKDKNKNKSEQER